MSREAVPSLLVGDVLLKHPDLEGLDAAVEIFALDIANADCSNPSWGSFWDAAFAAAPALPGSIRAALPEEGGFILRPISIPGMAGGAAEVIRSLQLGSSRRVMAPSRQIHADLAFPEPRLVSNEIFCDIRYAMAPSVLQCFDFDDIHDGTLRIFAFPDFEGDVRALTVVDESAAAAVLAQSATAGMRRKRLLQFLHASASAPAAARWPTTADCGGRDLSEGSAEHVQSGGLFAHQKATVAWMNKIESFGRGKDGRSDFVQVEPVEFAGISLGSSYEVALPRGGVIAHPPGSGKTRIVATLIAEKSPQSRLPEQQDADTLIVCPAHLKKQWADELASVGATGLGLITHYDEIHALSCSSGSGSRWTRLIVDEPQDCPAGETWGLLQDLASELRTAGAGLWLLCGTAQAHLDSIGRLLLGQRGWNVANRKSEWQGTPHVPHLIHARFIADPPWACLPMPPLEITGQPVVLRPRESADAAVASLAGFVLDGVMLLSFGADTAFAAAQERDQLLLQMGWLGSIGTAMLPSDEHTLADWEGTVAQRSQQKLDELSAEIAELESQEGKHAARYQFASGDAAFAADLSFLAREAVRFEVAGLVDTPCAEEACTAEWNALLPACDFTGRLVQTFQGAGSQQGHIQLLPVPENGDFASVVTAAEHAGANAIIFEADTRGPRPFGYRHDQVPPGIPAAMISSNFASRLKAALSVGTHLQACLHVITRKIDEDEDDVDQGLVSAFIAEDVVNDELHRRLKALRAERDRCQRALRFARHMRILLEQNEANCPICFHTGSEAESFAVMPDCFHVICKTCLDSHAGYDAGFTCPMCRVNVARLEVIVFRAQEANRCGEESPCLHESKIASTQSCEDTKQLELPAPANLPSASDSATSHLEPITDMERNEDHAIGVSHIGAAWEILPSKLQRLITMLREILSAGAEERALVFTQWAVHVTYLHDVLERHGVQCLALVGELEDTMDALRRFGQPDEACRVLLLSSQRHSSGINLQAARHVIIVHPYCTPTASSRESISRSDAGL